MLRVTKKGICQIVIVDLIISILVMLVLITFNSDFITSRAEPECVTAISDTHTIDQKLYLEDVTTKIYVSVCLNIEPSVLNSDEQIIFRLIQNEASSEYIYNLDEHENSGWKDIRLKLDYSLFEEGESVLSIYGNNLSEGMASVLLTSGEQNEVERESVIVANVPQEGYMLALECKSISTEHVMLKFLIAILCVFSITILIWLVLSILKAYPATGLAVIVILMTALRFDFFKSFEVDNWVQATWMSDYRHGFINRGFAATILSIGIYIFNGNTYISGAFLHDFLVSLTMVVSCLVVFFIYKIEKTQNTNQEKYKYNILIYFWITSPWFINFFMTSGTLMGRLDILLLACYIATIMSVLNSKFRILIPLITIVGILIYPIYTIIYFPTVFLLMVEDYLIDKKKTDLINIVITTISTLALTVYFYISGTLVNKISMAEYYAELTSRTDRELNWDVMLAYPFHLIVGRTDITKNHLIFRLVLILLFSALSLSFVTKIWASLLKNARHWLQKVCYFGFIVAPWCVLILLNYSDMMKFMVGIYTSYVTAPIILGHKKEEVARTISIVNDQYEQVLGKNYLLIHVMVFATMGISLGTAWPYSEVTNNIVDFIQRLSNI